LNRENHPPFTRLDPAGTSATARSPTVGVRPRALTGHIVAAIMFVPPFSTLKHGIYWVRGTVGQGEPSPFTRLDPASTSSTSRSPTDGSRPRAHETYRVGDYVRSPCLDPQSWDIYTVEQGEVRPENHPPFTCLDPISTSSTARSPTVGSRPRAHETYHVGDYVRSPFFDPQTWDILDEGYC